MYEGVEREIKEFIPTYFCDTRESPPFLLRVERQTRVPFLVGITERGFHVPPPTSAPNGRRKKKKPEADWMATGFTAREISPQAGTKELRYEGSRCRLVQPVVPLDFCSLEA